MSYRAVMSSEEFNATIESFPKVKPNVRACLYRVLVHGDSPYKVAQEDNKVSTRVLYDFLAKMVALSGTSETKPFIEVKGIEAPCDICQHFQRCKTEYLSCYVFNEFVKTEVVYDPKAAIPNELDYNSLFPTHPVTLNRREIKRVLQRAGYQTKEGLAA